MRIFKKAMVGSLVLILVVLICGCTITQGVFTCMSYQSSDTSLAANYQKFDGSIAKRVSLKAGDEVSFSYQPGEGLQAVVKQGKEELCVITDGGTFTAPDDDSYDYTVQGSAKIGAFLLSWEIE